MNPLAEIMTADRCLNPPPLSPLAMHALLDAPVGTAFELPRAGSSLENPFVYDAVARELQREQRHGRVAVVDCVAQGEGSDSLIKRFVFVRAH